MVIKSIKTYTPNMRYRDNFLLKKLGQKIKKERLKKGLTQEKLAEKCDVHVTYISLLERAQRDPGISHLKKISEALNIRIIDLLK